MFKIQAHEINNIIHDLISIAQILKGLEINSLSEDERSILHSCEVRLYEIRDNILQSLYQNNENTKED